MFQMNRPLRIAPSILSADFGRLAEEVRALEVAGADLVHVDVMDGRFVPNMTIGPVVVAALRPITHLPLDVHLMIIEPERYIDAFAAAGADIITVHVEACPHLHRTVQQIRGTGKKASVSLNPHSPIDHLDVVLPDLEMVLLMTVNPGLVARSSSPGSFPRSGRCARRSSGVTSISTSRWTAGSRPRPLRSWARREPPCWSRARRSSRARTMPRTSRPCGSRDRPGRARGPSPGRDRNETRPLPGSPIVRRCRRARSP